LFYFILRIIQSRLIFTGLLPFLYLSLMNLLIYRKLKMNKLSNARSRSVATNSAGNLAAILLVVGKQTKNLIEKLFILMI
jgi:type VI protein secretion system component VasK